MLAARVPVALAALAAVLPLAGTACVYEAPPPPPPPRDPYGSIAFDWSFDGLSSCQQAGVDEVEVIILRNGVVETEYVEPCVGGGLELTEWFEGFYEVIVEAYARNDELLYAGEFGIEVFGGQRNYAGVIELDPLFPVDPPPPADGDVGLFWTFLYPTDETEVIDCDDAGVDSVDVIVTDPARNEVMFAETFNCAPGGAEVTGLPAGRYELEVIGYGTYHNEDLPLYDAGVLVIDIVADQYLDLGDVPLGRVDDNFSDLAMSWTFVGETCATAGVENVNLAIQRVGNPAPEDAFAVDCAAAAVVRRTFVPGSYVVSASATGQLDTYVGVATVDAAPGFEMPVTLQLIPE